MTVELWVLIYIGVLALILGSVDGIVKMGRHGFATIYKRNSLPPAEGVSWRCERALFNLFESIPLFAALIIAAHVSGANNEVTYWSALIFAAARTLHPIFLIYQIQPLRSLIWGVGLFACAAIGLQLG